MYTEQLIQAAIDSGAAKAAVIPQEKIVTAEYFRAMCESNECGVYGKCWMCPPDVGEIGTLIARLRTFKQGLLYQTISELEDSYDIEGMHEAGTHHIRVSRKIDEAVRPILGDNILHLTCGGCRFCERCSKLDNEPCRFPDKALPSLESYGVDVFSTCKGTDLRYINGQDTVTYFGIVLF